MRGSNFVGSATSVRYLDLFRFPGRLPAGLPCPHILPCKRWSESLGLILPASKPPCLPACLRLPACLHACLPACLPASLPTYPPACLPGRSGREPVPRHAGLRLRLQDAHPCPQGPPLSMQAFKALRLISQPCAYFIACTLSVDWVVPCLRRSQRKEPPRVRPIWSEIYLVSPVLLPKRLSKPLKAHDPSATRRRSSVCVGWRRERIRRQASCRLGGSTASGKAALSRWKNGVHPAGKESSLASILQEHSC